MGVRVTVLGSGSAGNCTLLESEQTRLLIDAGLSARQIRQRLGAIGSDLETVQAILLTHEHADHSAALGVLSRQQRVPVYANRATAEAVLEDARRAPNGEVHPAPGRISWRLFETGAGFELGDLLIETFSVPHDAADPVGYVVRQPSARLAVGVITDLGHPSKLAIERLSRVDLLLLEANHDLKLLQDDPARPWPTKQRIMSRHGHLSNEDAALVAAEVAGPNLRHIILAHLSRDCNRPELARRVVGTRLAETGAAHVALVVAGQDAPTATLDV